MATPTILHELPPEADPAGSSAAIDAENFLAGLQADDQGSVRHEIDPNANSALQHEQTPVIMPPSKSRKFGRQLLRPFARGRNLNTNTAVTSHVEDQAVEQRQSHEEIDEARYKEIMESPLLQELPEGERAEATSQTFELYKTAKEVVAPVIVGFADYLLDKAEDRQIIFAARDGLGAYVAALKLKDKFDYGNPGDDQLVYAYLTRKVVGSTPNHELTRYLTELGVNDPNDSVVLADIGMYGTMVSAFREILPKVDVQYLISKAHGIPGYADGQNSRMASVQSVVGNPAIHFMEDTFSGALPSPSKLVEVEGRLVPNTLDATFPPAEALKREFAIKAIEDYAAGLEVRPEQPPTQAVKKLDSFLADPKLFKHLMVPHHR